MEKNSATSTEIWIELSRTHKKILVAIEKTLKDAGMPPLSWYDVLLELERAGNQGARAYVLREKLLLPQYGLSRLLKRIEKAGYLEKLSCHDDGRGQNLVITPSGKIARKEIWAVYAAAIEDAMSTQFGSDERIKLSKILVGSAQ